MGRKKAPPTAVLSVRVPVARYDALCAQAAANGTTVAAVAAAAAPALGIVVNNFSAAATRVVGLSGARPSRPLSE